MHQTAYRTSRFERLSYGGFFLGQNMIYVIQLQFLTYFYVEYVGLTLADTTALLLIAKLWDAFNDPIMGAIVDKCNFKRGKYLPWLRVVTYLIPLTLFFVFFTIPGSYEAKLLYAYITYLIWGMTYTVSDAPIFSLSTVMSEHTYERDVLMSYGRLAAAVAAITSAVFMSIKGATNWSIAVGIYCVLAFLTMFPLQFTAKERLQYQHTVDITFGNLFRFLFRNKYLLLYYLGYLAIGCTNTLQTMAVYFANSNLGNESMVTVIMGTTILPIIVMAPFLPKLIQRFGKKPLTMFSCIAVILLCVLQYVVGYDNLPIFLAIAALRVIFMQLPLMIYGMFTADCIEYGAYKTGQRTEGIAFSVQTLVTKLSGAICSTLCLQTLYYFGYVEQAATQSAHTLQGIWILMSLVPMFGYAIMFVVMCFYKLDETMVEEMMKANRSKGGILS